jgi:thymidylate kinase
VASWVLIEGMDLVGKTSVARGLVRALEADGTPASLNRGFLWKRNPIGRLVEFFPAPVHHDARWLPALYFTASLADRLARRQADGAAVVVQESYVDRSVAFARARGWRVGRIGLALRGLMPAFELVVILHAPREVRAERAGGRDEFNAIDRITLDPEFDDERHLDALMTMGRRHREVMVVDTSSYTVDGVVAQIVDALGMRSKAGGPG